MTFKELYIRCKNAFLYKVGMRFPYSKIRIRSIRKMGYQIGKNVYLPSDLIIAHNYVYKKGNLSIGDRVSIAPGVIIILSSHSNFSSTSKNVSHNGDYVIIKNDAWIGAGSTILNGVTIGEGAIVGCGSVVIRDVPAHTVVAGNPAKVIKTLTTDEHTD